MQPLIYTDLRILAGGSDQRRPGADPRATGLVFGALHQQFRRQPGQYAVAFPSRHGHLALIRVFAEGRPQLDQLVAAVATAGSVRDYAHIGYPQWVPADYAGPWLQYRRYRIPTRKADRHEGAPLRARRLAAADARNLPYLLVRSGSTGQAFGLRFEVIPGAAQSGECQPDGYGLARASAPFSLPDLP